MEKGKKNIFILALLAFTGAIGIALIRPVLPILTRRMGATGFQVGSLVSGFMLARAVAAYICGRFSDRIGRRKIFLPVGFFAYIISCILLFFSRNYFDILIISVLQGTFSGLIWPIAQVITIESSLRSFRTRALSFYFASGNAGMSIGNALLGTTIIFVMFLFKADENYAFRIVFLLSGLIYLCSFFISFFLKDTKSRRMDTRNERVRINVERKRGFMVIVILGFLVGIIPGLIYSIMVLYLNECFLIQMTNIAFILMMINLVGLFSMLSFSYLSDKKGTVKGFLIVCLMTGVVAVIIPFISNIFFFISLLVILGAGARSFTPISRSYMGELGSEHLGRSIGLINTVTNLGAVVGPLVGGFLYDLFPKPLLFINLNIAIFSIIGTLIILSLLFLRGGFSSSAVSN
jgi:MFS family permease